MLPGLERSIGLVRLQSHLSVSAMPRCARMVKKSKRYDQHASAERPDVAARSASVRRAAHAPARH